MADHTELPAKRPLWKMAAWLILVLLIAGFIAWQPSRKPDITHHRHFDVVYQKLKSSIYDFITDVRRGIDIRKLNAKENIVLVIDEEEFLSGLKEAIYKLENMKGYFDAGVFKILIKDNFCFIHADLDKAAHYISRSPLKLRESLARYAIFWSEEFYRTIDVKTMQSRGGAVGPHSFLGDPDVNAPVVFTQEMNDLYIMIFIFKNTPPLSPGEIP
jgi:hypothetical protein